MILVLSSKMRHLLLLLFGPHCVSFQTKAGDYFYQVLNGKRMACWQLFYFVFYSIAEETHLMYEVMCWTPAENLDWQTSIVLFGFRKYHYLMKWNTNLKNNTNKTQNNWTSVIEKDINVCLRPSILVEVLWQSKAWNKN